MMSAEVSMDFKTFSEDHKVAKSPNSSASQSKKITDEERNVLVEYAKNVNDNDFNHDIKLTPAWVRKILIAR